MTRTILSAAIILFVLGWAVADQPTPSTPPAQAPVMLRVTPVGAEAAEPTGRQKIEAILRAPANLDFGDRKSVTIQEILDQLHEKHQLSIRVDVSTMTWSLLTMFGGEDSEISEMIGDALEASGEKNAASTTTPSVDTATPKVAAAPATPPSASPVPPSSSATVSPPAASPVVSPTPGVAPAPAAVATVTAVPAEKQPKPTLAGAMGSFSHLVDAVLGMPVNIRSVDLKNVSVATALRHALDGVPPSMLSAQLGVIMPMKMTEASTLDYMIENDSLVITTRLNAQTIKETRVYSIKRIKDCKPEEISKVIRQAVRPWSWRSQINDLGEQMKASTHGIPSQILTSVLQTGAQLVSAESGITVTACPDGECPGVSMPGQPVISSEGQPAICTPTSASVVPPSPMPPSAYRPAGMPSAPVMAYPSMPSMPVANNNNTQQSLDALGDATVNAFVTMAQASISALEMVHFADPPTGTIQVLPGKLIITQSQGAHREIAELLKELEE